MNFEILNIFVIYISIMGIAIKLLRQRDKKIKLKKYEIDITYGVNFQIEQQLDTLIGTVFDEYKIYNLEFRDSEYIKEAEEQKIIKEVCNIVLERISPVFLTQLSTYFNIDNLGSIIATKISLRVAEYRISKNINKGWRNVIL